MKKITLILIAVFVTSSISFAHRGRTDKNGGHTDKKTGKYHKH